jgi:fructose-1,6-bisphosphatase I
LVTDNDDLPVLIESTRSGEYACVFDPLDSHSNPDASVATGSIFGIYKTDMLNSVNDLVLDDNGEQMDLSEQEVNQMVNYLQPGRNLYAAGYCMYSSSVVFVITLGQGVHSFTLDPNLGEFILTKSDIKCPVRNRVYSFNEGNKQEWTPALQRYIDSLKTPYGGTQEGAAGPYSHRYIGSLVGDFHRTLMFGGIYGYPATKKHPNGKLRLLYENAPLGFIMEQAGGKATTGKFPVLNITPKSPHQRTQFFAGSGEEMDVLETFLREK